ncbi:Uncharacterised protein [Mycobacterium tuberculosis]|nr:Uncharacterised protein [Mycobacterium tuberculosis]CKW15534.1 Uncharacterised protein [Mycobacterium tuberculosis]CKW97914.1 Uncharacterised protein [Mycobacterium tuberculosis]CKX05540.1 Uncharacterised protein [Mycobacterium tuberculosis]CKX08855.1 Uncharacterised protein [Mycobacterium tuberculosis]
MTGVRVSFGVTRGGAVENDLLEEGLNRPGESGDSLI